MNRLKYYVHILINLCVVAGFCGCLVFVLSHINVDKNGISITDTQFGDGILNQPIAGTGSRNDPYIINNEKDLKYFADAINRGEDYNLGVYSLENDIELTGDNKSLHIGTEDGLGVFRGIFLGNGHTICGFDQKMDEYGGLFINVTGEIYNLNVSGKFVADTVGAVACNVDDSGKIINCSSTAIIEASNIGGIAAEFSGMALNCVCNGEYEPLFGIKEQSVIKHCFNMNEKNEYISSENDKYSKEEMLEELNTYLGAMLPVYSLTYWQDRDGFCLSEKFANRYQKAWLYSDINGQKEKIEGFFSSATGSWCFCIPQFSTDKEWTACFEGDGKKSEYVFGNGKYEENFVEDDIFYKIKVLQYDDTPTLWFDSGIENSIEYLYANKRYSLSGKCDLFDESGAVLDEFALNDLSCRGNSSFQKSLTHKNSMTFSLDDNKSLLGLPANDDYVLISGFRDNSLLSYIYERSLFLEKDMKFGQDFRIVNLYVDGLYMGLYMLTGSQEISDGRFEIVNAYERLKETNSEKLSSYEQIEQKDEITGKVRVYYDIPNSPEDITGGYILEVDSKDFPSSRARFISAHGTTLTMKSGNYASKEQVNYIADFWQDFEDALYSPNGYNEKGKKYTDYLDLESIADLIATFELTEDTAASASIYFYKDSDNNGDGKLHAACHWDSEHSFMTKNTELIPWLLNVDGKADEIRKTAGFWEQLLRYDEVKEAVRGEWNNKIKDTALLLANPDNSDKLKKSEDIFAVAARYAASDLTNGYRWEGCSLDKKSKDISDFVNKRAKVLSNW